MGSRTKPKRILLVSNSAWNLVNFRKPIIQALRDAGCEVIAAAPPDGAERALEALGVTFSPLPFKAGKIAPLSDLALTATLAGLFGKFTPDAVLTFTIKPNIFGGLAGRWCGVMTIPTISGIGSAMMGSGRTAALIKRLFGPAVRRAPAIFFQNQDDVDLFVQSGIARQPQVRLVPGSGIDLEHFSFSPLPQNDRFTFLMIGRLLRDKGIMELVEAARLLRVEGRRFRLNVLGSAEPDNPTAVDRVLLRRWIDEGLIHHVDHQHDIRPYIVEADCVVLPSYREGLPRSLLEGASMGRPLVATNVPGCREVVEDGVNGWLCAPRSATSLADAMRRMMDSASPSRAAMGAASRSLVERSFAEQLVAEAYLGEVLP